MNKWVKCIDNTKFENRVLLNSTYKVVSSTKDFYIILDDNNNEIVVRKENFIEIPTSEEHQYIQDKYIEKATEIGKLVSEKNKQYGNAINNVDSILKILYPNGISVEQYKDLSVMVRMLDKMFRIAHGNKGSENAYNDLCGYGLLMSLEDK